MHLKASWQKFVSGWHRLVPDWKTLIRNSLPYVLVAVFAAATVLVALGAQDTRLGSLLTPGTKVEEQAQKQLEEKLKELETALSTSQDLLDQLSDMNADTQTLLDNVDLVSGKIEELKKAYDALEQKEQQRWVVPMRYKVITSPYGYRDHPVAGEAKFHYGIDMAADRGTPIVAARSGTVTMATYDDNSGYFVYIDHMDGFGSCYMHMDKYIVNKDQFVQTGQVIGYCGDTGVSTGVHLHFEVYKDNVMVNPNDYIDFY